MACSLSCPEACGIVQTRDQTCAPCSDRQILIHWTIFISVCVFVWVLWYVWLFVTPWTVTSVLPGSSVHGIFQARILEWAAVSFSRGSFQSNLGIQFMSFVSPALACGFVTSWATREAPSLYEWTAKGQSLRLGYLIDFRIQAALLHKRCRASMTKHRKSCRSNVVSDLFFPITVSFCPLNWWGNWGSESLSHSPKVKQLSSIWKIWEFSKIGPFTPRKNTESQMECLSLIIFPYCLLHHSQEKTKKKQTNKRKKRQ